MFHRFNKIIKGSNDRDILIDSTLFKEKGNKKVIIFSHGFKGFKDWGPFNKIAEYFAKNNFIFVKFNFSHNGTTINDPFNFVDLDAFGNNNFCKELDDLGLVINWARCEFSDSEIILFGHSRGGAISILKSVEEKNISHVVSWASPSDLVGRLPAYEKQKKWKASGVAYAYNGRTKQNMPLYYQFYENCLANTKRLNIENAVKFMRMPHLHVHGDGDSTVSIEEAYSIREWSLNSSLHIIKNADHVFGAYHPYELGTFPRDLKDALDATLCFLKF